MMYKGGLPGCSFHKVAVTILRSAVFLNLPKGEADALSASEPPGI